MPPQITAGISVLDDIAHFVLLKINEYKIELIYLEEYQKTELDTSDTWFLKPLAMRSDTIFERPQSVSVALDKKFLFIHNFPIDSNLTKVEQNEHINWEISQHIPNFHPQEYISDTHILKTSENGKINDIISVTVKRGLIYAIHEYVAQRNLNLNFVDASQFAVEDVLLLTQPEIKNQECVVVGLTRSSIEYSRYSNGHLIEYNGRSESDIDSGIQYLKNCLSSKVFDSIFIFGNQASAEVLGKLRRDVSSNISILNPFRRLNISTVRNYDRFVNNVQRFVPAVGIALRKS